MYLRHDLGQLSLLFWRQPLRSLSNRAAAHSRLASNRVPICGRLLAAIGVLQMQCLGLANFPPCLLKESSQKGGKVS